MRIVCARAALACLAAVLSASPPPGERQAPSYSAASVVNLASGRAGDLAPNTLAAVYGDDLASTTRARTDADLQNGILPSVLPGAGVTVKVNGLLAALEYASPAVVVFVVPPELLPGPAQIVVTRNALNGPTVKFQLKDIAPALLPLEQGRLLARRASDNVWITAQNPAAPGQEIILFATGLGPTLPPQTNRKVAPERSAIALESDLSVLIDGSPLPRASILYAGVSPGTAAIYEIRILLPQSLASAPEIQISLGGQTTESGAFLHFLSEPQPAAPAPRSID